jgi:RNA polymerase sigma factor (sigma-70 family)
MRTAYRHQRLPGTETLPDDKIRELIRTHRDEGLSAADRLAARNTIILSNSGIRCILAMALMQHYKSPAFDMEDVADSGVEGDIEAIGRFDLAMDNKYITYATWWMKQSMRKFLKANNCTIRRSIHAQKIRTEYRQLRSQGLSNAQILELMAPTKEREKLLRASLAHVSSFDELGDELPYDPEYRDGESDPERTEYLEPLRIALDKLDPRSRRVLVMFSEDRILREIAAELGVTKERVRQIKMVGLERMRKLMDLPPELLPAPKKQACVACGAEYVPTMDRLCKNYYRCERCHKVEVRDRARKRRQKEATL